ncbi:MAG TPA: tetratricopeptide repeat protein [Sedimentisphaerales bacterium]|nr:tetratricopeptide repeat protein [Sedimentisphaerales bacterium]
MSIKPKQLQALCLCVLLVAVTAPLGRGLAAEPAAKWYKIMDEARNLRSVSQIPQALGLYEEALAAAPTDEHRADTLMYVARAYENLPSRQDAIDTYKRILADYPDTRHAPRIYFRLGEVHRSITLLPNHPTPSEERRVLGTEMVPSVSIPYFEKCVSIAPPVNGWVRASRIYLANLYKDTGREDLAWQITHEIANLDIYDVTEPMYIGPYKQMNAPERTLCERLDDARQGVVRARNTSRRRLVRWSISSDPTESILKLQQLISRYPGTDIQTEATEQIELLREKIVEPTLDESLDPNSPQD